MEYAIEVLTLPVADVDRAKTFYGERLGFDIDVDYAPTYGFRVVQATPRGSRCSVQFGTGLTDAAPGSVRDTFLVVTDIQQARDELAANGVAVSDFERKVDVDSWQGRLEAGVDVSRRDYASFFRFADPDGNTWTVQERGHSRP